MTKRMTSPHPVVRARPSRVCVYVRHPPPGDKSHTARVSGFAVGAAASVFRQRNKSRRRRHRCPILLVIITRTTTAEKIIIKKKK